MRRHLLRHGTALVIMGIAAVLAPTAAGPSSADPLAGLVVRPASSQAFAGLHLAAVGSLYCLVNRVGAGETPVVQSTCSAQFGDQFWSLEPSTRWSGAYHIRNTYTNKCIVTRGTDNSSAIVSTCAEYGDQVWSAPYYGRYRLFQNVNSGKCLTSRTAPEAQPYQSSPCDGNFNTLQQWEQF